jgi:CRISPR-associated protein Cas1
MILVIDHRATRIRDDNGLLRLERPDQPPQRVAIQPLELVVVYGNPLADTAVWRKLAAAGVPTVLLPARGTDPPAVLANGLATQLPLRRLQHRCAADPARALPVARALIAEKLAGYDLPLRALQDRHGADASACAPFLARRDAALDSLATVPSIDSALGVEGQVAHAWFGLLARTLAPAWRFTGRNRRPPRDPVNAVLSLGYTLAGAEIHQGVMAAGLDPSFGFLHQPVPGRESMVLDLTELFRAAVDHVVLSWIDPAGPDPQHWYQREDTGCRLSKAARPAFFEAWAHARQHWPQPSRSETDPDWPRSPLPQQVRGAIERLRTWLKTQDADA